MWAYRLIAWLFGAGFLVMFVVANLAFNQRDEARAFRAAMGDVELVCKAVDHD